MPSTTSYSFDDIVLVHFPFTDQQASKQRPAVVVSSAVHNRSRDDIILMAVTSQVRPTGSPGEVRIARWRQAGLIKPSMVKPIIMSIHRRLILRRLGRLQVHDRHALEAALHQLLEP
jgi:mRNA interferase MazF